MSKDMITFLTSELVHYCQVDIPNIKNFTVCDCWTDFPDFTYIIIS